jgi:hypothetical protein
MNLRILLLAVLALAGGRVAAQDDEWDRRDKEDHDYNDYTVSKIKPELLKDADAVVRNSHTVIDIVSPTEATVTEWYAVTIMNEHGSSYGLLNERKDRHVKIDAVYGWLYDRNNKSIGKMKKTQLEETALPTDAFFDEEKTLSYDFACKDYPYTVVYKVVKKYKTTFILSGWYPQPGHNCSVEKANVQVHYPADVKVNYRMRRMNVTPAIDKGDDGFTIKAAVKDMPTRPKWDYFSDVDKGMSPCMQITCDKVALDEFTGSLTTWKDWGAFVYAVNANRDQLPDATKKIVHSLSDTCATAKGKVDVLYKYLQQNTRYVNIVIGIGGWQAMEAQKVAEKGYGDCKGLANYMKALLKEAGVSSNLILVEGDASPDRVMQEDFPYHCFNHMILCVPMNKDTIWLDCTSKYDPTGYMASFTSNRKVLMLTDKGGVVVRTPAYNEMQNRVTRTATVTVDDKGDWHGTVNATYSGYWWDKEMHVLHDTKKEVSDYFNTKLQLATYSVSDYNVTNNVAKDGVPYLSEHIPFTGNSNVSKAGNRIFFSPRVFAGLAAVSDNTTPREDSFHLQNTYQVADTTVITFATTYDAEKLAKDIDMEYPFGSYHARATFTKGNELRIISVYTQKSGRYAPALFADYNKMAKMFNNGVAYDKVVLNKKG